MAAWRRVAQKARKKEVTAGEESRGKWGVESGGCEAAVKRGRVRESRGAKPELADRVDTDRGIQRGWTDGRERREDKADGGRRVRRGWSEESGEGVAGGRIGENRARLGFAMTNGRRGHSRAPFVSIQERLPRWTLSCGVPLFSSPGSPHPSSARILRLPRFSDSDRRAAPYFPFVRAIYRPASSRFFPPFLHRLFTSWMWLICL